MTRRRHPVGYPGDKVVSSRRLTRTYGQLEDGDFIVTCWCEQRLVSVSPANILAGRTESCGRPQCQPEAATA